MNRDFTVCIKTSPRLYRRNSRDDKKDHMLTGWVLNSPVTALLEVRFQYRQKFQLDCYLLSHGIACHALVHHPWCTYVQDTVRQYSRSPAAFDLTFQLLVVSLLALCTFAESKGVVAGPTSSQRALRLEPPLKKS